MKKATMFGLAAVMLIGLVAISAFAIPSGDGNATGLFGKGKAMRGQGQAQTWGLNWTQMQEHREAVDAAIDASDYDAWLDTVKGSPMEERLTSVINEGNFDRFVEMHKLMQDAGRSMDDARAIADELGIQGPGFGRGQGDVMMKGQHGGNGKGTGQGRGLGGCPHQE
ncbi:hypothetical protein JW826_05395 [Candidatus Woesearchaeota archaeon]|nr:hypothetical protein [Candidatus Woesearchaeota archaeon]